MTCLKERGHDGKGRDSTGNKVAGETSGARAAHAGVAAAADCERQPVSAGGLAAGGTSSAHRVCEAQHARAQRNQRGKAVGEPHSHPPPRPREPLVTHVPVGTRPFGDWGPLGSGAGSGTCPCPRLLGVAANRRRPSVPRVTSHSLDSRQTLRWPRRTKQPGPQAPQGSRCLRHRAQGRRTGHQ